MKVEKSAKYLFFFVILATLLTACGGGSGSGSGNASENSEVAGIITGDSYGSSVSNGIRADYNVSVADDMIIGAKLIATANVSFNGSKSNVSVCDSFTEIGHGKYTLNNCSQKPAYIYVFGGFMDINDNGSLDSNEPVQFSPLILNMESQSLQNDITTYTVTPITTLVSNMDRAAINTLINKLGYNSDNIASTSLFFGVNDGNKLLRHAISSIINSCVENGIDIQKFSPEFVALINASDNTGFQAIKDAINKLIMFPTSYEEKYGKSQIQSFLNDNRTKSILTGDDATVVTSLVAKKTRLEYLKLVGFVNTYLKGDNIIKYATVNIYLDANTTPLATASTDQYGKYSLEIKEKAIPKGATLVLVAEKSGIKLTSTLKSDTLWSRRINNSINQIVIPDLSINYITTLTSVRINSKQIGSLEKKLVFDTTYYLNKNQINEMYFVPMTILYEDQILPWGPNVDINTSYLIKFAKTLPSTSVPYVLDLESWSFGDSTESNESLRAKMTKYITVIDTIKATRPDLKFGFFGLLPDLQILESSFNSDYSYKYYVLERMNNRYDVTKELANHVDILFPELYTYWPETESYSFTGRVNIGIGIYGTRYNKPIIPIIWPYYPSGISNLSAGQPLSDTYFTLEFTTLIQNNQTSAIAIWGGSDFSVTPHTIMNWNENFSWWQYIKQYIVK